MKTRRVEIVTVMVICMLIVALGALAVAKFSRSPHRYTCKEILGPKPRPGYIAILPPGYSAVAAVGFDDEAHPDFRIWDDKHRLVCDAEGRPVE